MRRGQVVGLLLWRGGLLVVAMAAAVELVRMVMRYYRFPLQVEIGTSLVGGGILLVVLSMILERISDAREEGDLSR